MKTKTEKIKFKNSISKAASKLWSDAIDLCGGVVNLAELSKMHQAQISIIKHGIKLKDQEFRKQAFPTPEQAIRVSMATKGEISAEGLIPHHDFSYIYEYVKMRKNK